MKIIYIDMDDTLCDFNGAFRRSKREFPEITWQHSREGFFLNLEPIEGGVSTIKRLIDSKDYDPYILTAPSVRNPFSYLEKRLWIEKYFGLEFCKKLIISPNKSLNIGDYLIDDNIKGKGQEGFAGQLIHFGSDQYPDWASVGDYLGV